MLKLAGAAAVLAAGLGWGSGKRLELSRKLTRLLRLRWEIACLRSQISGRCASLYEAFSSSEMFSPAAKALSSGRPVREAVMPIGKDIEGFDLFAAGLEAETAEGQLQNIDIFLLVLEDEIRSARDDLSRRGRLYLGGGILAGAAIVIFLL